jgi:hypothetical protein
VQVADFVAVVVPLFGTDGTTTTTKSATYTETGQYQIKEQLQQLT